MGTQMISECSALYLTSDHSEIPFCLLYKHLTNKKKSNLFSFKKENMLPFIHVAK